MPPDAEPEPRHELDLRIVLDYQEARADEARRSRSTEARLSAEACWRNAYFDALKARVIEPHVYPEPEAAT